MHVVVQCKIIANDSRRTDLVETILKNVQMLPSYRRTIVVLALRVAAARVMLPSSSQLRCDARKKAVENKIHFLRSRLGKAKVFTSSGHGGVECFPKVFVALVLWKIELIEASVRTWQTILATVITVNVEAAKTIHTFEFFEAVEWNLASTGHEL